MKSTKNIILLFTATLFTFSAFSQVADGTYFILSKMNYYGLSSQEIEGDNSLRLLSQSNNNINSQMWVVKAVDGGYKIINKLTGEAIDVFNSSQDEASEVSLYDSSDDDATNQTWSFEKSIFGNCYYLKAKHSEKYLTVENAYNQTKEGFGFTQYNKSLTNPNQIFI